jgi:F420-non-reducing hydrogenase small subunit
MKKFAVLQLTGCSGCEVSLLNAEEWLDQYKLVYMPLVISAYDVPQVDVLLVSGYLRSDENLYDLRRAARQADKVVALGTCATSWVAVMGDRAGYQQPYQPTGERYHLPRRLPRSRQIDSVVTVDRYLPGCPPTPELIIAALFEPPGFNPAASVCLECGRKKLKDMRPSHLAGFLKGDVLPDICLINQGFLCIGTSTRGGCRAMCSRAGHPCVGCRGPSDAFIEKESQAWFNAIQRVFTGMTDIPGEEIEANLRSPQLSLFLGQFSDYAGSDYPAEAVQPPDAGQPADAGHSPNTSHPARSKEKVW